MTAFLASLGFVVLAEMGDKTQLLGMAFATRYRWQTVMWGVLVATVLNHLFAVVVGNYITRVIPLHYVQIAAAASFIIFGLWTIRGDELGDEAKASRFSPFWTVTIAFFIAEMGDKTQLATVALAAQFKEIVPVWLGTTAGMMIANAIGIIVGIVMGRKIPERAVKWFAALIFIFFGLFGLYQALPRHLVSPSVIITAVVIVCVLVYVVARWENNGKMPRQQE
ncbi:protein of unknown function UPF0016 [Thermosinus carboxydivorans Nor1]|uniref:GDT1 family protein n=1 Tax=Thermosinus carboxydivorans Nor1 TaxID=401526 RepID=A1HPA6_9FIRM|nr:TMEM165/GDT1 family protein [Thermosinus carboxydivorans]EAX48212.1 protein of unknown function UPF0016 [Thermosinus carboxydivorans Nor1]